MDACLEKGFFMNSYYIEIVIPFMGGYPELTHSTVDDSHRKATTKFFDIFAIEVPEQHLGITIAKLDGAVKEGRITAYHFQQA
jgi:hypothetical protein